MTEHEISVIKKSLRHSLVRLIVYTHREDIYEIARQELVSRDQKRIFNVWIKIMLGE